MSEAPEQVAQIANRKADRHFTTISNDALRDPRLSWRAKGVLAGCLTHRREFWLTRSWIDSHGTEGRDAITSAITELRELGYVHDEWIVEGGVTRRRMVWTDHPDAEAETAKPASTLDTTENPLQLETDTTENPLQLKTRRTIRRPIISKKTNKKEKNPLLQFPPLPEGAAAAEAARCTGGNNGKRFRPTTEHIPVELLPVQAELMAFWAEKAGSHSERAWKGLLTELEKIQSAVGGGTEVVRQQLAQATQSGWRSVMHKNWLAYGQVRQLPARRSRQAEAVDNVIAFLESQETQNQWHSTQDTSPAHLLDFSSSSNSARPLMKLA